MSTASLLAVSPVCAKRRSAVGHPTLAQRMPEFVTLPLSGDAQLGIKMSSFNGPRGKDAIRTRSVGNRRATKKRMAASAEPPPTNEPRLRHLYIFLVK